MSITVTTNTPQATSAPAKADAVSEGAAETKVSGEAVSTDESQGDENKKNKSAESATTDNDDESKELSAKSDDESDDDGDDSETKDDASQPNKKGKGFRRRIEKLKGKLTDKEREAEYWREIALKNQATDKKEQPLPKDSLLDTKSGKPKPDDFDTQEDFIEAVAEWKAEQKLQERDSKSRETQLKNEYQSKIQSFQKNAKALAKQIDDYEDVLEEVSDITLSLAVQDALLESDNGPELMYELAKNKSDFERINSLSPMQAMREIGRLEARLTSKKDSSKKEVSTTKAPPPANPVTAKAASATKKSIFDKDLSQADYERLRREQLAQKNYY
jgi:hypothetical protein